MINIKKIFFDILFLLILPWLFLLLYFEFGNLTGFLEPDFDKYSFLAVIIIFFAAIIFMKFYKILIILSILTMAYAIIGIVVYKRNSYSTSKYVDLLSASYVCLIIIDVLLWLICILLMNVLVYAFCIIYSLMIYKYNNRFKNETKNMNPY